MPKRNKKPLKNLNKKTKEIVQTAKTKEKNQLSNKPLINNAKKLETPRNLVERIATGVEGFDTLIEGGVPKNTFILLSGGTGTGKSIFGMNFLAHGAQNNEPGLYVSLEEGYDANEMQMSIFGWDMNEMQKNKTLLILQPKMYNFDKLLETILNSIYAIKAKRVVIDSISLLELYFEDKFQTRRSILDMTKALKDAGVTTIAISEVDDKIGGISREGVEEFVSDGVIMLYMDKKENIFNRAVSVRKMRATNHSLRIHPLKIMRPGGIIVYPNEETFNEF
jgi:KaiC/GvpD/RAD55 family RecA-like ATPase